MTRLRRGLMLRTQARPVTIPAFWPPSAGEVITVPVTSLLYPPDVYAMQANPTDAYKVAWQPTDAYAVDLEPTETYRGGRTR